MHPRPPGQSDGAAIPPEPPCSRHAISRTCFALGIRGTNPEQHQPQGTAVIALSTVELPDGPPAASSFGEIRALREPAGLAWRSRRLVAAPRGDGRVAIVVPGFRTGDRATAPLRAYLRRLGYDARGWGLGINRGHPESDRDRLAAIVGTLPRSTVRWALSAGAGRGDRSRGRSRTARSCGRRRPLRQSDHRRSDAHHRGSRVRPGRSGARNGRAGSARRRAAGTGAAHQHLEPQRPGGELEGMCRPCHAQREAYRGRLLALRIARRSGRLAGRRRRPRIQPGDMRGTRTSVRYSGISAGVAVAYRDRIVFHSLASPVMRRASQM